MGSIVTATCENCGLNQQLFLAFGFSAIVPGKRGPTYDMVVGACFNCGVLAEADRVSKQDKCPKCKRRYVPYKTNRFFSDAPQSKYSRYVGILTVGAEERKMLNELDPARVAHNDSEIVRYLCPLCVEKRLIFEDSGGMWD
jgi:predicted RNA-binding Zn-ribbon protein involved in translation (DUF1610 family)